MALGKVDTTGKTAVGQIEIDPPFLFCVFNSIWGLLHYDLPSMCQRLRAYVGHIRRRQDAGTSGLRDLVNKRVFLAQEAGPSR